MRKNNVAIISVLVALIALLVLILSLAFMITSQPAKRAKVENVINPLSAFEKPYTPQNIININDIDSDDDDDEEIDEDPIIKGLPDITLDFGQTITLDLDNYASDDEDSHSELSFNIIYTPTTSPAPLTLNINSVNNILTITESNGVWTGTQLVTIEVKDTDGNTDEDSFVVTITDGVSPNNAPIISEIPDVTFTEDNSHSIDFNNYVTDTDNTDSELTWTCSGNTNVLINIDSNNVVTFTATPNWNGNEDISFRVEDPDGNFDEDTIKVTVLSINDAPVIAGIPDITFTEDGSDNSIDLDDYVSDTDNADSELTWTYTGNTNILISIDSNNVVTFTATSNWNGNEDITFRAEDPDGNFDEDTIKVTVTPIEDDTTWLPLSDQTIDEDSLAGTIVYAGITSMVSDDDGPVTVNVASSNTHFSVEVIGNDLILTQLNKNWYGFETVTLEANGKTASFTLNVNQLLDDCIEACIYGICETYCD